MSRARINLPTIPPLYYRRPNWWAHWIIYYLLDYPKLEGAGQPTLGIPGNHRLHTPASESHFGRFTDLWTLRLCQLDPRIERQNYLAVEVSVNYNMKQLIQFKLSYE